MLRNIFTDEVFVVKAFMVLEAEPSSHDSPGLLFYLHYQNNIAHLVLLNYLKKLL